VAWLWRGGAVAWRWPVAVACGGVQTAEKTSNGRKNARQTAEKASNGRKSGKQQNCRT